LENYNVLRITGLFPQVDPKYQKKIEAVVRKPPRKGKLGEVEEKEEPTTPCPFCDAPLLETELNCANCKNTVPFCIATVSSFPTRNLFLISLKAQETLIIGLGI